MHSFCDIFYILFLLSTHVQMGLDGVEIFTNSSASYHELCKADSRVTLVKSATIKVKDQSDQCSLLRKLNIKWFEVDTPSLDEGRVVALVRWWEKFSTPLRFTQP